MIRVRYYSHIGLTTGYGRAALELALALSRHPEIDLELVQIPTNGPGNWTRLDDPGDGRVLTPLRIRLRGNVGVDDDRAMPSPDPDVVIVHTLPLDCVRVLEREDLLDHPRTVAYTTWEAANLPAIVCDALAPFTRLWTTSPLAWPVPVASDRLRFLPHAYDPTLEFPARVTGPEERYRFYWIGAWSERKNPVGLIRAYAATFAPTDDVELVIRSKVDPVIYAEALASTGLAPHQLPITTLVPETLSDSQIWELHANADCYVSATRGEAWDLGCFEAYLSRRMIITPKTGSYAYLAHAAWPAILSTRLTYAHVGVRAVGGTEGRELAMRVTSPPGLTSRDLWREVDLLELGRAMRHAYEDRVRSITHTVPPAGLFGHARIAEMARALLKDLE